MSAFLAGLSQETWYERTIAKKPVPTPVPNQNLTWYERITSTPLTPNKKLTWYEKTTATGAAAAAHTHTTTGVHETELYKLVNGNKKDEAIEYLTDVLYFDKKDAKAAVDTWMKDNTTPPATADLKMADFKVREEATVDFLASDDGTDANKNLANTHLEAAIAQYDKDRSADYKKKHANYDETYNDDAFHYNLRESVYGADNTAGRYLERKPNRAQDEMKLAAEFLQILISASTNPDDDTKDIWINNIHNAANGEELDKSYKIDSGTMVKLCEAAENKTKSTNRLISGAKALSASIGFTSGAKRDTQLDNTNKLKMFAANVLTSLSGLLVSNERLKGINRMYGVIYKYNHTNGLTDNNYNMLHSGSQVTTDEDNDLLLMKWAFSIHVDDVPNSRPSGLQLIFSQTSEFSEISIDQWADMEQVTTLDEVRTKLKSADGKTQAPADGKTRIPDEIKLIDGASGIVDDTLGAFIQIDWYAANQDKKTLLKFATNRVSDISGTKIEYIIKAYKAAVDAFIGRDGGPIDTSDDDDGMDMLQWNTQDGIKKNLDALMGMDPGIPDDLKDITSENTITAFNLGKKDFHKEDGKINTKLAQAFVKSAWKRITDQLEIIGALPITVYMKQDKSTSVLLRDYTTRRIKYIDEVLRNTGAKGALSFHEMAYLIFGNATHTTFQNLLE
jgi:hypothetical protein